MVSVLDWPLHVETEYVETKARLLQQHLPHCVAGLAGIAQRCAPITLRYRWIVLTDSAVIALAEPSDDIHRLRQEIRTELSFPEPVRPVATIVHTTLFQFGGALDRPQQFLKAATASETDIATETTALTLSEEWVYPSPSTRSLGRFAFGC